jgi:hypothetical protein
MAVHLSMIDFHAFFFQQNQKYKVVHILAYLSRLDTVARQNGKYDHILRNSMKLFQIVI